MKKWIVIAVILMCFCLYAIVKLSMSENQNAYNQPEETQSAKQIDADNVDKTTPAESTQQINTDDTDKATPEEDSGSAVPATAAQVEAVTKAFGEFKSAIVNEDYEQAWMLVSDVVKSRISFEKFKEGVAGAGNEMAKAIIRPESSISIEGRVGLLLTGQSNEANEDSEGSMYFFFIEENGQWKFYGVEPAQNVDTPKE
jgi:hypothetical protein